MNSAIAMTWVHRQSTESGVGCDGQANKWGVEWVSYVQAGQADLVETPILYFKSFRCIQKPNQSCARALQCPLGREDYSILISGVCAAGGEIHTVMWISEMIDLQSLGGMTPNWRR